MLPLILVLSLSFLILVALVVLRWQVFSLEKNQNLFQKSDNYLEEKILAIKKQARRRQNKIPSRLSISNFLSYQAMTLYNIVVRGLKNIFDKLRKYFEKIEIKEDNLPSPYWRDVTDYKNGTEKKK